MTGPRILGQAAGTGTLVDLYTAPAGQGVVISSIVIASEVGGTVEIRLAPGGEADAAKHVLLPSYAVSAGEHTSLTEGITMAAGDVVRVNAQAAVNVHLFGTEL